MDSIFYIILGVTIATLVLIGLIVAKLYMRSTKQMAFVRTGFGGEKVILNGGAIVLPVFHEISRVSMKTLKLEVKRENTQALITGDRMRVDVLAEFYVRVKPDASAISQAAQTLGERTMHTDELRELIEGKFVDALRSVASGMKMTELHERRGEFVQKVQQAVSDDLFKNGLELESVSLTGLDQTNKEHFNPDNAFDAEGLLKLTQEIEERRKLKNDIEKDKEIEIQTKNLEAKRQSLELLKEEEYAELHQEREIAIKKAGQESDIKKEQAEREKIAENAKIDSEESIKQQRIVRERETEEARIKKEQAVKIAEQEKQIAISHKSKAESIARSEADEARAKAVEAEQEVITVRAKAEAERIKAVEIVEASKIAERDAVSIKIGAAAGKAAAVDDAEAKKIEAEAEAEAITVVAEAEKSKMLAEAEGIEKINKARNALSLEQIELEAKLAMISTLPSIIEQSVKPMENIDSIKIFETNGFGGMAGGNASNFDASTGGIPNELVNSALKYRSYGPLLDNILTEFGLKDGLAGTSAYVGEELGLSKDVLADTEVKTDNKEETTVSYSDVTKTTKS